MSQKMKKEDRKVDLSEIAVQSFVTSLNSDEQNEIKGGTGTGSENVNTFVPIHC